MAKDNRLVAGWSSDAVVPVLSKGEREGLLTITIEVLLGMINLAQCLISLHLVQGGLSMSGNSIDIGLGTGIDGGGCADEPLWGTAFGIRCPVGLLAELCQT